jgi:hypothetical protein
LVIFGFDSASSSPSTGASSSPSGFGSSGRGVQMLKSVTSFLSGLFGGLLTIWWQIGSGSGSLSGSGQSGSGTAVFALSQRYKKSYSMYYSFKIL